jgi:hypothetical protein
MSEPRDYVQETIAKMATATPGWRKADPSRPMAATHELVGHTILSALPHVGCEYDVRFTIRTDGVGCSIKHLRVVALEAPPPDTWRVPITLSRPLSEPQHRPDADASR